MRYSIVLQQGIAHFKLMYLFRLYLDAIDAALDCFAQSNGAILKNVVKQMLQLDPRMRPSFSELSQYL